MNTFFKKVVTLMLVGVMVLSMVGCGSKTEEKKQTDNKTVDTTNQKNNKEDNKEEEKITLNVWHLWTTDADANAKSFSKVLKTYEEEHPNVKIAIDATENEAYKTKIKTAMAANEAPDVFFAWGAGFAKPFVDAGQVLCLDEYISDEQKGRLLTGATSNVTYDNKLYGLPFIQWMGILYCNEELFDKYQVKIPDTYEDLLTAIDTFNKNEISPISVGAKDGWPAMFWQNASALRTAGIDSCNDALDKKASFNQPEFIESARIVEELVNKKAFDEGSLAYTNDEAKIMFLNGEVPMHYMGSWLASEIQDEKTSLIKDKVVAKNFPAITNGKGNKNDFLGGAVDCFMVNKNTKYKKEAAEFVAYVTEKMSKESFILGAGLPAWKIGDLGDDLDSLSKQLVDLANDATGFVLAWDTKLTGADAEKHKTLVQELFAGSKTPEEFVKEMQKLNE